VKCETFAESKWLAFAESKWLAFAESKWLAFAESKWLAFAESKWLAFAREAVFACLHPAGKPAGRIVALLVPGNRESIHGSTITGKNIYFYGP
jgi:hypothetical protein